MRSGIELEVEELANVIMEPPTLEAVADALFARVDDYRANMRDGIQVSHVNLRLACEALCSTVAVINQQAAEDARFRELNWRP